MGSINISKHLSTVPSQLTSATSNHPLKTFWECWDTNLGPLKEGQECDPLCYAPPGGGASQNIKGL